MISVISGKLGAGKSWFACRMIVDHVRSGGIVATNMSLRVSEIQRKFRRRISSRQFLRLDVDSDPRTIPRGDFRGRGRRRVFVVLDEALNWFESSASKVDPRRESWGVWLRQSDKLGQDVFFIAQTFERSAKWLRELAQVSIEIRNLGQTRILGMPVGKWLCLRRLCFVLRRDVRTKGVLGLNAMMITSDIFSCYDTSELYGFPPSDNAYESAVVYPPYSLPVNPLLVRLFSALLFWHLTRSFVIILRHA